MPVAARFLPSICRLRQRGANCKVRPSSSGDAAHLLIGGLIEAAQARAGDELVGLAKDRLPRSQHEKALRRGHRAQAGKGLETHWRCKIEEQVAAEYKVRRLRQRRPVDEHILYGKVDPAPKIRLCEPASLSLVKPA